MEKEGITKSRFTSFRGNLVEVGLPLFVFQAVLLIVSIYRGNTFTLTAVLLLVVLAAVLAVLGTVLFWFTVSLPLIRRMKR